MGSVDEVGTTEGNISATSEGTLENFQTTFHSIIESPRVKAVGSLVSTYVSSKIDRAKELFISDQTVGVHRKNIMKKFGVRNSVTLLRYAFENDLTS